MSDNWLEEESTESTTDDISFADPGQQASQDAMDIIGTSDVPEDKEPAQVPPVSSPPDTPEGVSSSAPSGAPPVTDEIPGDREVTCIDGVKRPYSEVLRGYEGFRESTQRFQAAAAAQKEWQAEKEQINNGLDAMFSNPDTLFQKLQEMVPPQVLFQTLKMFGSHVTTDQDKWTDDGIKYRQQEYELSQRDAQIQAREQAIQQQEQQRQAEVQRQAADRINTNMNNVVPKALEEKGIKGADLEYVKSFVIRGLREATSQGQQVTPELIKSVTEKLVENPQLKTYFGHLGYKDKTAAEKFKNSPAQKKIIPDTDRPSPEPEKTYDTWDDVLG